MYKKKLDIPSKDGIWAFDGISQKWKNIENSNDSVEEDLVKLDTKITNVSDTLENAVLIMPYFQQAAQHVLFHRNNDNSYPNTMKTLKSEDDDLVYVSTTEGGKAKELIVAVGIKLKNDFS